MNGEAGADMIYAKSGAQDTIVFDAATAFSGVDYIDGFTSSVGNDKLDISDILDGHYDPNNDVITDFVQIQTNGNDSELYVDVTGTGTFGSSQHIATIGWLTGLTDEAALVTAGTLLAA
ncbi:type I secretion C-terminal target domain-containing protein [Bradyrhizobium barranii subsp. apii]|uniref:Type I secretion C-terminal target domain-containing protein n=1 Tax=Bradyrhizobium barranii subsp. apii TaxID=2819348 RepID=A0A8U0FLM9_9BRAD|nr:type I secretion C-terminal target domain-containing protein [Bradyrhizobium barranii]UPT88502.1 type I secretion C-terminal target domain-containing protein [Bradyrhizobium barranii subsp. apii]